VQAEEGAAQPIVLRCFPPADDSFRTYAEAQARMLDGDLLRSVDGPGVLEQALRAAYPHSVVRPRADFAALDLRPTPTWYVYRDGQVIPGEAEPNRFDPL
jgi:hypothetical protein